MQLLDIPGDKNEEFFKNANSQPMQKKLYLDTFSM